MPIVFLVSAYLARPGSLFADGGVAKYDPNHCVVASTPKYKLGTKLKLEFPKPTGTKICLVRDRLGKPKNPDHLDWLVSNYTFAINWGNRKVTGTVVKS